VVEFCFGLGMRRNSLGVRWGLGATGAGVRREEKSPGTTSEERLGAEAPVRCRYCASQPAISEVVTRDGPALYNRGDRSSMTAFGALLVVKLHWPVSLAWVSPDSSLIATIRRKLPEFAKACADDQTRRASYRHARWRLCLTAQGGRLHARFRRVPTRRLSR